MQRFQDLEVWQRAFGLIKPVYRLTARYPREERFGLISQTRDCVVAIPTNIAEGCRRRTPGEFRNSLSVASGEDAELECLLIVGVELGYATADEVRPLLAEVRRIARMLNALDGSLARRYAKLRETTRPPHSKPMHRGHPGARPTTDTRDAEPTEASIS